MQDAVKIANEKNIAENYASEEEWLEDEDAILFNESNVIEIPLEEGVILEYVEDLY